jgi:hypothetical protein
MTSISESAVGTELAAVVPVIIKNKYLVNELMADNQSLVTTVMNYKDNISL